MNVLIEKAGPCRRKLEIDVDASSVSEEYQKLLKEYAKQATLPGFRKGKAPLKMVASNYSKDLNEDLKQLIVSDSYREAVKKEELDVVAVVGLEDDNFDPQKGFKFSVTVDVEPDFELPEYTGIKIKSESTEPTEEQIDEVINSILGQYASYEEIQDRAVERDDMVKIDYEASVDGKPLEEVSPESSELAKKEDYWILANDNAFIPEMADGLVGLEIGAKKDVPAKFASDFSDSELAGKDVTYHVTIKALRGKKIPEISERILKDYDVETEQELRETVKKRLAESAEQSEQNRQIDEICSYLLKKTKLDVPQSSVGSEMESVMQNMVRARMSQGSTSEDMENEKDRIIEDSSKLAEDRVKLSYIIDRIADQENIEVSDEELEEVIESQAKSNGMEVDEYKKAIEERSSLESLKARMKADKTMKMLKEKAVIK